MEIHWNILDAKRKAILPLLKDFMEDGFYLAGGTGLALQYGHRDSNDFDFFTKNEYDTDVLIEKLKAVFKNHKISITYSTKNTVYCEINETIQLSFFSYNYELLKPTIATKHFNIASVEDIACMKLSAITSRSVEKDYIDLFYIFQKHDLHDLMEYSRNKYPSFDELTILDALPYFDDVKREHIVMKEGDNIPLEKIKIHFDKLLSEYHRKKELNLVRKKYKKGKDIER